MRNNEMNKAPHADSYYVASANAQPDYAPLQGEIRADVCVIGAGLTGCSTALNLAERGYKVVVLEAERVGWGASGRNGGQMITGFAKDMGGITQLVGDLDARRLWDMSLEAVSQVRERVAKHQIDCDLKRGHLLVAIKPRHVKELEQHERELRKAYDYDVLQAFDNIQVRDVVGSERYIGGLFDPNSGHLHPLNYTLGLSRAATDAGVQFFEASRVRRVNCAGNNNVYTDGGQVRCQFVVYCCNAYIKNLQRQLRSKIMPVGTYIIATEPMDALRAMDLIRNDASIGDINFVLDYFRLSADKRMLFGGAVSYSTVPPRDLTDYMRQRMLKVYPQLHDVKIDYTWGGFVGITMNRLPHWGRLDKDVYFAQGFSGHGVALTGLAGKLMAEAIAGTAERFDVFARIPHKSFPGGSFLRTPGLVLGMAYYRLRDLL